MNRFFVEGAHQSGDCITLAGGDARKIVTVLRKRDGDEIEIVDSAAQRFGAKLLIDGKTVQAVLGEKRSSAAADLPRITVAQSVPKGQKMDFVVEKLTELGVARILPLHSERTVVTDVGQQKIERWRRLAKTAAQQCGRDEIPEIADPIDLPALCAAFSQYDAVLFPWELADRRPLRETLPQLVAGARAILVVIGPEGGFSHSEADASRAAGAHLISLGSRILRTETAALVVVSLLGYLTEV